MKKVYIVHGWTYNLDKWKSFNNLLKKNGYQPVMLKVPGLTSKLKTAWTLDDYVKWLKDNLEKERGKVILLGHSNGGRIALAYCSKYQSKVSDLILIGSAGIYHNDYRIRLKRFLFKNAAKIGKKFSSSDKMRTLLYKLTREKDYKKADPVLRQTMANLISVDLTPKLSKIKNRTLIFWGEYDSITPIKDAKILNRNIKDSKLFIVPGRHSPHYSYPEEIIEKLISNL